MPPKRIRSPHPGVVLLEPRPPRRNWRARYRSPDSGKLVFERLPLSVTTAEGRRAWAIDVSRRLIHRAEELRGGAYRAEPHAIDTAVDAWLKSIERLAANSREVYTGESRRFRAWCTAHAVRKTTELTRGRLRALRDAIVSRKLSTVSVNAALKRTGTLVKYLAERDMLLSVSDRDIRAAFKPLPAPLERPVFYTRDEIARLPLDEPLARVMLLTGCRIGELLALDWRDVNLPELEFYITAASKTKRARTVRLDVCPSVVGTLGKAGKGRVFAAWDYPTALKWSEANDIDWRTCRRTCATYSCALATLGPWQSAKRLGHSVQIAEKHYAGLVRVPPEVRTLEAAMGIG